MTHVLLINPSVGPGVRLHPVSGKSGKLYGTAALNPQYSCPTFRMTLAEYDAAKLDLIGNPTPGCLWIPVFELSGADAVAPAAVPQPPQLTNRFRHLGEVFEFTSAGIRVGPVNFSLPFLLAFRNLDPAVWFRPVLQEDSIAVETKRIEPVNALLSLHINDLRKLAKHHHVEPSGNKESLVARITAKQREEAGS